MYSSFSSTDNGCNSCASLDDAYGSQVQNVNTHTNQYAQPNVLQNHANNVSPGSVAMPQQNNAVALPNIATMVPPQQSNHSNAQVAMNNMVQKVVAPQNNAHVVVAKPVVVASPQNNKPVVVNNVTKEGFVAASNNQVQVNIPGRMVLMNIGAVVLLALAVNECSKYYINRAIQTSEGQPHYYLGYAVVMICVAVAVQYLSKKMI
mgnify:CR=1 FL=1